MNTTAVEDRIIGLSEWQSQKVFGKYRGKVVEVKDGDDLGIISALVPDVFDDTFELQMIRPCTPFGGDGHGLVAIPEPDDGVWIEFEAGDISLPIWTGFWWADGEIPEPKGPLVRSFITTSGHKLILNDDANEVSLLHKDGAEIVMTDSDITIAIGDGKAELKSDKITLSVGAGPTAPHIEISSSEIIIQTSTIGSVKLTSGGVDIGNGAMKIGS